MNPVRIWPFHSAPEELRIPFNGGDEDWVTVCEKGADYPFQLDGLGCCNNDRYVVDDHGSIHRQKYNESEGKCDLDPTDLKAPNFIGCTVIIACHA